MLSDNEGNQLRSRSWILEGREWAFQLGKCRSLWEPGNLELLLNYPGSGSSTELSASHRCVIRCCTLIQKLGLAFCDAEILKPKLSIYLGT